MEKNKGKLWEKGIIIALILIVLNLIFHFTGQDQNPAMGWIGIAIFVVAIIYITIQYSKEHDGQVTFGNLFAHGFKVSAIVTLIMIIWVVLMYKVIFPDMQETMMQMQRTAGLKKGYSEEQLSKGLEITKKYFMTFAIGGTLLTYAILGLISALLGAAFAKKTPANSSPFQQ
jgi:hypothetical protein